MPEPVPTSKTSGPGLSQRFVLRAEDQKGSSSASAGTCRGSGICRSRGHRPAWTSPVTFVDRQSSPAVAEPDWALSVGDLCRLAGFFLAFAALGYLLIELIPTQVLTSYLGADSFWSVPLAATLGIPIYLKSDASLPMVASLMNGGMGPGAALAFLVTGAGTSVAAISGMLIIARWKVVTIVVATLWIGALILGYLAPLWL
jgi:hypothetical protein